MVVVGREADGAEIELEELLEVELVMSRDVDPLDRASGGIKGLLDHRGNQTGVRIADHVGCERCIGIEEPVGGIVEATVKPGRVRIHKELG